MDRDQINELVLTALNQKGNHFSFEVIEEGIRQDGDWWYVPVIAKTRNGIEPPHEILVNIYANIEERLQDEGYNILFIPSAA